ncbi:MAG: septum formation initiator family protein [candidate division WOR-3 bacterium]
MKREILSSLKRWILLVVFVLIPLLYFGRKLFLLINAFHTERILQKQILILSAENELLKKRIDDYRRGLFVETRARDDLGMIKKGEKVYFLKQ